MHRLGSFISEVGKTFKLQLINRQMNFKAVVGTASIGISWWI
jgi:hypothetical protein